MLSKLNIRQDLGTHFFWLAVLAGLMGAVGFSQEVQVATVIAIALMKEIVWDKIMKKGTFDWVDILFGVLAGVVVALPQVGDRLWNYFQAVF